MLMYNFFAGATWCHFGYLNLGNFIRRKLRIIAILWDESSGQRWFFHKKSQSCGVLNILFWYTEHVIENGRVAGDLRRLNVHVI